MLVFKSRTYCARSVDRRDVSATIEMRPGVVSCFYIFSAFFQRKGYRFLLAFCWIGGLICGMGLCRAAGPTFSSWMRRACDCPVSIGRLSAITLLPFLLSAAAVYASRPGLLYGITFCKGCALSFAATAVHIGWGNAGWLARWLLCFGSLLTAPLLYGYWLRHISGRRPFSFWETALLFSAAGIIGSFHFFVIAPLLARVIHS